MASKLLGSFPRSFPITTGGSCWKSKKCANDYYASSYVARTLWHKNGKLSKEYCIETSLQHNWEHHYKGTEGGSTCDKFERKYFVNATSTQSNEPEPQAHGAKSIWKSTKDAIDAFRNFSALYALIALLSSILSASLLALDNLSDLSPKFFIGLLQYVVTFFFMHMYVAGVNQLTDLEIDKINKPHRLFVAEKISFRNGAIIVASFLFTSFALGWMIRSKPLLWGLFVNFVLMTAYSVDLPLMRWKKSTMLTLVSCVTTMLTIFNLAPFLHMKTYVLKKPAIFPRSVIFTIVVMSIIYTVIPLAKDITDIEGDKAAGLQTLAIRLGPKRTFWFCVSLLEMAYGVAIILGATFPILWSKIFTVLTHAIMALILWYRANYVDLKSKDAVHSFFIFIFKLVYVENILILFVR